MEIPKNLETFDVSELQIMRHLDIFRSSFKLLLHINFMIITVGGWRSITFFFMIQKSLSRKNWTFTTKPQL